MSKLLKIVLSGSIPKLKRYFETHKAERAQVIIPQFETNPVEDRNLTLVHVCSLLGNVGILTYLISKGCPVYEKTSLHNSALHLSVNQGNVEVIKILKSYEDLLILPNSKGEIPLHLAINSNQADLIEDLIDDKLECLRICDLDGHTVLTKLCSIGKIDFLKALVGQIKKKFRSSKELKKKKISDQEIMLKQILNFRDALGWNCLHHACSQGHNDIVQFLLEEKVEPTSMTDDLLMPIHIASKKGEIACLNSLLLSGVDIESCSGDHLTPLCIACKNGSEETVSWLLEKGADCKKVHTNLGQTPLHLASLQDNPLIIGKLLKCGSKLNLQDYSGLAPISIACREGNLQVVDFLCSKRADLKIPDNGGWLPIHYAAACGFSQILEKLLKSNIDIDSLTNKSQTALHLACNQGHIEIVEILIKNGSNIHQESKRKWTPIHFVAKSGSIHIAKLLVNKGVDLNKRTTFGSNVLHIACQESNSQVLKYFLEKNIDPNSKNIGNASPLHLAVVGNKINCLKILLKFGVSLDVRDNNGDTSLHLAIMYGKIECIPILIKAGSPLDAKNKKKLTPLMLAQKSKNKEIITLLVLGQSAPKLKIENNNLNKILDDEKEIEMDDLNINTQKDPMVMVYDIDTSSISDFDLDLNSNFDSNSSSSSGSGLGSGSESDSKTINNKKKIKLDNNKKNSNSKSIEIVNPKKNLRSLKINLLKIQSLIDDLISSQNKSSIFYNRLMTLKNIFEDKRNSTILSRSQYQILYTRLKEIMLGFTHNPKQLLKLIFNFELNMTMYHFVSLFNLNYQIISSNIKKNDFKNTDKNMSSNTGEGRRVEGGEQGKEKEEKEKDRNVVNIENEKENKRNYERKRKIKKRFSLIAENPILLWFDKNQENNKIIKTLNQICPNLTIQIMDYENRNQLENKLSLLVNNKNSWLSTRIICNNRSAQIVVPYLREQLNCQIPVLIYCRRTEYGNKLIGQGNYKHVWTESLEHSTRIFSSMTINPPKILSNELFFQQINSHCKNISEMLSKIPSIKKLNIEQRIWIINKLVFNNSNKKNKIKTKKNKNKNNENDNSEMNEQGSSNIYACNEIFDSIMELEYNVDRIIKSKQKPRFSNISIILKKIAQLVLEYSNGLTFTHFIYLFQITTEPENDRIVLCLDLKDKRYNKIVGYCKKFGIKFRWAPTKKTKINKVKKTIINLEKVKVLIKQFVEQYGWMNGFGARILINSEIAFEFIPYIRDYLKCNLPILVIKKKNQNFKIIALSQLYYGVWDSKITNDIVPYICFQYKQD
ncbi:ankyrin repeat-containing protein [Anaeramoeba flamelloides]|uniref:Ankyrin repeat-containing protein n=1 Tax=Anaeramoeba flamelloides TaxID=1746091 RepID=A0AAV7Y728_9EUKA|nr:ankyrin repeat-containing protein [Anaeramoeba flamelloides]